MSLSAPYAPVPVNDVELAYPAEVGDLMPAEDEIPDEFWRGNDWSRIIDSWFFAGLPEDVQFHLNDGIDGDTMFRHLRCVIGSYQFKHQYKVAAAAFLLSRWCDRVENWRQP